MNTVIFDSCLHPWEIMAPARMSILRTSMAPNFFFLTNLNFLLKKKKIFFWAPCLSWKFQGFQGPEKKKFFFFFSIKSSNLWKKKFGRHACPENVHSQGFLRDFPWVSQGCKHESKIIVSAGWWLKLWPNFHNLVREIWLHALVAFVGLLLEHMYMQIACHYGTDFPGQNGVWNEKFEGQLCASLNPWVVMPFLSNFAYM